MEPMNLLLHDVAVFELRVVHNVIAVGSNNSLVKIQLDELVECLLIALDLFALEQILVGLSSGFVLSHVLEPHIHLFLLVHQFFSVVFEEWIHLDVVACLLQSPGLLKALNLILSICLRLVLIALVFSRYVVEDVVGKGGFLLKLETRTEAELLAAEGDQIEPLK